jgi:hypothetical protein
MVRPIVPSLCLLVGALTCVPSAARAQRAQDTTADSTAITRPPTTPEQDRYQHGLRTAGRGVAQMKNGIDRVLRAKDRGDTSLVRQAGRRLAGLCVAARGFIVSGRSSMDLNAYDAPTRKPARDLAYRLDSLATYASTCQHEAGKTPELTSAALLERLKAYDGALDDFRTAIGLPALK